MIPSANAEDYGNDPEIELAWAEKAFKESETHYKILQSVADVRSLRLTKHDDLIYESFRRAFPDMSVNIISVDEMKSETGKVAWREYCELFKEVVEDYNFAMLLRVNSSLSYSDDNTTLAPRIQFLAIEVARNREGFNQLAEKS